MKASAWSRLLFDAVDTIAARVEEMHLAIAARPFDIVDSVPLVRAPARGVRRVHDGIAAATYGVVRGLNAVAGLGVGALAAGIETSAGPLRPSPTLELAASVLNGAVGDHLARRGSELGIAMEFRHDGKPLPLDSSALAGAFPEATGKLAIFVHGLMANEDVWRFYARTHYGEEGVDYGRLLCRDLGYTPLYVRYNSGLHISENGRRLAELFDALPGAWPAGIDEIALIGHSMGGLVARSACHYGRRGRRGWVESVRHVVCLGSPHLGSPLEKAANAATWLLDSFRETRPLAALANGRSAGIKDLRFGYLTDEDWRGDDPDALLRDRAADVPPLPTAAHYLVAATLTRAPGHPVARAIGDSLVRVPSATAAAKRKGRAPLRPASVACFGGLSHLALVNHPDVYERLRAWLTPRPASDAGA